MLDRLYQKLIDAWIADIDVLTTPWVYMLVIPACCYAVMMVFKWAFLSLPIWLPIATVLNILRGFRVIEFSRPRPPSPLPRTPNYGD